MLGINKLFTTKEKSDNKNAIKNPEVKTKPPTPSKPASNASVQNKPPADDFDVSTLNIYSKYEFIYHTGESLESGEHHLNSWIPIFEKYQLTFITIVRNRKIYEWIRKNYPFVHVAYARRAVDLESVINLIPKVKLALYSSANINNGHLIRFNHIKHAFIGHGDSEKAGSAHKGLRWFDEIWTAGQAHIDRFANIEGNFSGVSFVKVGRPNLKPLLKLNSRKIESISDINALYLPTWEGVFNVHDYSSISNAHLILDKIDKKGIKISAKFHPYTGGREPAYKDLDKKILKAFDANSNCTVISKETNLLSIIHSFNFFICDISSVITECLSLNKPILVYIPKDKKIDVAISNMPYSDYCYIFSNIIELEEKVEAIINKGDYLKEKREAAMRYYIGMDETLEDKFEKLIKLESK